jgi:hypothetical protein
MWRVLGITEEEMCVKISLAFYRTFGAVGLLFMFKERYMFPLDLCLSSWTKSYSLTCIDVLNFHGVTFASCLGFSLERCYPAEWSSMVATSAVSTSLMHLQHPESCFFYMVPTNRSRGVILDISSYRLKTSEIWIIRLPNKQMTDENPGVIECNRLKH